MQENILIVAESHKSRFSILPEYVSDGHVTLISPDMLFAQQSSSLMPSVIVVALDGYEEKAYLRLVNHMITAYPDIPVLMLLQYGEEALAHKGIKLGAHDFLIKPVPVDKLKITLKHAISIGHMRRYIDRLEHHIAKQVGISMEDKQALLLSQVNRFLVDEHGAIKPMRRLEQEIIESALKYNNGCVSRAARSLGIGRSTLYRKVESFNRQIR